jgi:hypothetical protein
MVKKRELTFEEEQEEFLIEVMDERCLEQEKHIKAKYSKNDEYYQQFFKYKSMRKSGSISKTLSFLDFMKNNMSDLFPTPDELYRELENAKKTK